jgi:molecular chaperone DnaK
MVHAVKKVLQDAGDKATEEEKTNIQAAINELEEALKGDDKEAIEAKTKTLMEASSQLTEKMAAAGQSEGAAAGAAGAGAKASGDQSKADSDDVVDAEFEEVNDDKK